MLVPAVRRIGQRTGRVPRAVAADRQYGEAAIDAELAALKSSRWRSPQGQASRDRQAHEHTRPFRRLVKWRTGSEGPISHLKHRSGWDRTLMDGIDGARIWCGHGVFAHHLVKIGGLLQAKQQPATRAGHRPEHVSRHGPDTQPQNRPAAGHPRSQPPSVVLQGEVTNNREGTEPGGLPLADQPAAYLTN
jgi:hypothetical protein